MILYLFTCQPPSRALYPNRAASLGHGCGGSIPSAAHNDHPPRHHAPRRFKGIERHASQQIFDKEKLSMNEIAQLLQEKAGLSPEQSQEVAQAVIGLIKSKVPAEFQGMLDSMLGGNQSATDGPAAATGGLGSLLGAAEGMFGGHNG
jgi:hypothetical protein